MLTAFRWTAATAVIALSLCGCRGCVEDPGATANPDSSPPFAMPSSPAVAPPGRPAFTRAPGWRQRGLERILIVDGGEPAASPPRESTSAVVRADSACPLCSCADAFAKRHAPA